MNLNMSKAAIWINATCAGFDCYWLSQLHKLSKTKMGSFFRWLALVFDLLGRNGILFISFGACLAAFSNTRRLGVSILVSLALGALLTNLVIKPLVNRPRPYKMGYGKWWKSVGSHKELDASFPSGHTTAAMSLVSAMFFVGGWSYGWMLLLFALVMGLSRCYLMVHYPSDILGAFVVGLFTGWASSIILVVTWKEQLPT